MHWTRDYLSAWEGYRLHADECRELDGERVLVLDHGSGRGKASGLELPEAWGGRAVLFQIRQDKVIKMVIYGHRDRALVDLGLEG